MRKKVLIANRLDQTIIDQLDEQFDLSYIKTYEATKEELYDAVKDVHGIIGHGITIDKPLLKEAKKLEIVCNISVGFNNFDVEAMKQYNVMGTNTPDVLTDTVADVIFGLLIATARRIPEMDRLVKDGKWKKNMYEQLYGLDVHHKKIGIIGMGRIGEAIANRAHHGFHMDVLYHTRSRKYEAEEKFDAVHCSLEDLLQQSDYVVLMTPLTEETKGLLSLREFQLMKDTAIFINGSRGQTIVEKDLITALETNEIAAAGLDVFEKEPVDPDNPLLKMNNVVTLPHIGSATYATELKMATLAYENLCKGLTNEMPVTLVDKAMWDLRKK